jgi:hypothetical protein
MVLKVDTILNSSGNVAMVNGYPRRPGQIIEYLAGMCDGGTVTVASGTYTLPNVTALQATTTTYTDINGSTITYMPPVGTNKVIYKFNFSSYWVAAHAINDYKFFIDGIEVLYARHNRSGQYIESRHEFEWVIPIGGTTNTNTGRQAIWATPKTLKMQVRHYGGSNYANLFGTTYWDGASSNQFNLPHISIIALA